jgi:hypothetical protein
VYICSVLEVNVAILVASIPIFWPLVEKFAANKILVVNEIEVRTSRRSSMRDSVGFIDIGDNGGRVSRMSINISGKNARSQNMPPTSFPDKDIELGRRLSQESGRELAPKTSVGSFGSESRNGSIEHYQDRYVAAMVVPDFDKLDGHAGNLGRGTLNFTTRVERAERAEIPFDHIKALTK